MRLGIIARSDNTGLGNQTRELVNMLTPSKILLINSEPFNKNKQHPEWYGDYECITTSGFANTNEIVQFLSGIDVVLSCEIFYNYEMVSSARSMGIKTVLQYNYEFLDYLVNSDLPYPDILIAPSMWNLDKVRDHVGDKAKVIYLPPPTDSKNFIQNTKANIGQAHKKVLHVAGKIATGDRNGTNSVIQMMKYSKEDYEMVIKVQGDPDLGKLDNRITVDSDSPEDRSRLYHGFDAMVLPRRYGGLCLPLNEALVSALPVFMTDISPNNQILPKEWLVKSSRISTLKTRASLDVYSADPKILGEMVDEYMSDKIKDTDKNRALDIGLKMFSPDVLKDKYLEIMT